MASPRPDIFLAPSLRAEKFMSMDLYAQDLMKALAELGGAPPWQKLEPDGTSGQSNLRRLWTRTISYPMMARREAAGGVLHVLDHSYAHLCRFHPRSVVTCHDIAEYRVSHLSGPQFRHWRWRVEGMRRARHIIAISGNTQQDLIELLGIPAEKISVVHYGVDPIFQPVHPDTARGAFPELAVPELKILHVGSNILRKNIPVLIEALARLELTGLPFRFVKVGDAFSPEHAAQLEAAGLTDRVIHLGFRSTEELPAIYSLCDVFVFPSTYEGFGRPILEAQACGTPAVLADSSCLAEVGADAALYFPAADPARLAECLISLADAPAREPWIAKGLANAARFTWQAHAEGVRRIYRDVLAS